MTATLHTLLLLLSVLVVIARSREASQRALSSKRRASALRSSVSRWWSCRADRIVGALSACTLAAVGPSANAAQTVQVLSFGPNLGNLRMFEYVPDGLPAGAPLVVALHGCTQSAISFDNESGWTDLADRLGFALLLPEQQEVNHDRLCFNWYLAEHSRRGQGEPASIMAMVDAMKARHGIDRKRIFVTGLSAGGAMTAVMLAAYPDVFSAGAIVAGIPYGCASTGGDPVIALQRAWVVAQHGEAGWAAWQCGINLDRRTTRFTITSRSPQVWRLLLREAGAPPPASWPKVSLWHGNDDRTVDPQNLVELMEQWTAAHGIDPFPDSGAIEVSDTTRYQHREYKDANGNTKVETFAFAKLGHAVPVNPGIGPGRCGRAGDHFTNVGVCGALLIARFWGLGH